MTFPVHPPMDPLSLVNSLGLGGANADSEINMRVRELLSANLRHCIRLNKLAKLKGVVAKLSQGTVNWQACLILAINEKRPAIVSYLVRDMNVRLPFYHWNLDTCGCEVCASMTADSRCYQVYVMDVFPCAVAPMYVFSLDEDPMAYCLRMGARLSNVRLMLVRENMVKGYKNSKRNIGTCLSLFLDQTIYDKEAQQLLLDDVEEDLIECTDRYSKHLGRTLMFTQFRLNKAVVHRATQAVVEAQFSAGSDFLGDMWSIFGFIKMLLVCAFAFAVLMPVSIIFPHPRLIEFLRSARILAMMEVISIITYMLLVLVGSNVSSNDVQSIVCLDVSDAYVQMQMFGLAFIVARIIDEAYNLSIMTWRQFYVSMFDFLLTVALALHFSSLLFLIIWSEDVDYFGNTIPDLKQHLCAGNRSGMPLCNLLGILNDADLASVNILMDPVFYVNSVTAVGNLFLYISLGNVFVWQKTMGVLALTVQSMMKDVAKFLSVLFIVFIAFTTAMTNMYRNYTCGTSAFGNKFSTVAIQFFWAMFGMTQPADYKVTGGGITWDNYFVPLASVQFTAILGLILYASWMVLGFVVCVNLLIAMLSVTFQQIQADKDNSWLYARTRRMLRFIMVHHHQLMPLPVPYNVASPLVFGLHYLIERFVTRRNRQQPFALPGQHSEMLQSAERRRLVENLRDRVAVDLRLERVHQKEEPGGSRALDPDAAANGLDPEELDDVFIDS